MKNKKAFVFTLFIVIFSFIVLLIGAMTLFADQNKFNKSIGEGDAALIQAYTTTEKTLFSLDQIAELSTYEALDKLINQETKCGKYYSINKWTKQECYPKIIQDYKRIFKSLLKEKIKIYNSIPTVQGAKLPLEYEITLTDKKIIGTAMKELYYWDHESETNYKTKANFKVIPTFNLNLLENVLQRTKELLEECAGKTEEEFKSCATLTENWKIGKDCLNEDIDDNIVPLCYNLKTSYLFDQEKELVLKFAITPQEKIIRGKCCSPNSNVPNFDCKTNNVDGWWASPEEQCTIQTGNYLDKQPGKVCCK